MQRVIRDAGIAAAAVLLLAACGDKSVHWGDVSPDDLHARIDQAAAAVDCSTLQTQFELALAKAKLLRDSDYIAVGRYIDRKMTKAGC